MTTSMTEKIIDGLIQVMEGFAELQEMIEEDYKVSETTEELDEPHEEVDLEVDAAIVTEMRTVLDAVIETEDYSPEEVAALISTMTEALEEIDPTVFDEEDEDDLYSDVEYIDDEDDEDEEDEDPLYDDLDDLDNDDEFLDDLDDYDEN